VHTQISMFHFKKNSTTSATGDAIPAAKMPLL